MTVSKLPNQWVREHPRVTELVWLPSVPSKCVGSPVEDTSTVLAISSAVGFLYHTYVIILLFSWMEGKLDMLILVNSQLSIRFHGGVRNLFPWTWSAHFVGTLEGFISWIGKDLWQTIGGPGDTCILTDGFETRCGEADMHARSRRIDCLWEKVAVTGFRRHVGVNEQQGTCTCVYVTRPFDNLIIF